VSSLLARCFSISFVLTFGKYLPNSDYTRMAATSTAPSTTQKIALRRSPASQYPVAALKQRIALVHPLAHAAGLLSILTNLIELS